MIISDSRQEGHSGSQSSTAELQFSIPWERSHVHTHVG